MTSETPDSTETFVYDSLDRLKTAQLKIPSTGYDVTESYSYDGLGNLTQKGGKTYAYTGCTAGGGPHAVCTVDGGTPFEYDANGNMTSGRERTVQYNPANKPIHIDSHPTTSQSNDTGTVDFVYGADGHRVVQSAVGKDGEVARTVYVGLGGTGKSIYERTTHETTGETEHVHFIYAGGAHGGNAFALRVVTEGGPANTPPVATRYNHFDHLGSVTAISDETGQVIGSSRGGVDATMSSYDAWGARRSFDGSAASPASFNLQVGHREFTGHEAIPNVGLVNMNGRVYDPELGRFLSPDPNVQFIADLQSYNRYSYVLNNPLRYTDPTGYAWYSFLTHASFWVGVAELGLGALACAGGPQACLAAGMTLAMVNSSAALVQGAPFGQVALGLGLGLAAGQFGGAIGSEIGKSAGAIVGGAVAGAVSGAMMTAFMGGSLGRNILIGAASGAASAAITWSLQGTNPVSQEDVAEQQGGGGGSGARQNEVDGYAQAAGNGRDLSREPPPGETPHDEPYPGDNLATQEMDKQHAVDPSREYSAEVTGVKGKNGYSYDKTQWGSYADDDPIHDNKSFSPKPPPGPAGHLDFGGMHLHTDSVGVGSDFSTYDIENAGGKVQWGRMSTGEVLRYDPQTGWVVPIRPPTMPGLPGTEPYWIPPYLRGKP